MADKIREVALSIPCRRKGCNAPKGVTCAYWNSPSDVDEDDLPSPTLDRMHQVRYNDARRILDAEWKIADWNQRYGGKQT